MDLSFKQRTIQVGIRYCSFYKIYQFNIDLFKRSEGQEFSFKINPKSKSNPEILILYNLVGKIIGKSLFERIPLNIYLDISLIKNILNQPILFEDIRKFDSQVVNFN